MLGGGEIHEIHSEYSEHKLHNVKKKKMLRFSGEQGMHP